MSEFARLMGKLGVAWFAFCVFALGFIAGLLVEYYTNGPGS